MPTRYYVVAWESKEAKDSGTIIGPFREKEDAQWSEEAMSGWCDETLVVRAASRKQAVEEARRISGEPIVIVNKRMREELSL